VRALVRERVDLSIGMRFAAERKSLVEFVGGDGNDV